MRSYSSRNDGHWNQKNVAVETLFRRLARLSARRIKSSFDAIATTALSRSKYLKKSGRDISKIESRRKHKSNASITDDSLKSNKVDRNLSKRIERALGGSGVKAILNVLFLVFFTAMLTELVYSSFNYKKKMSEYVEIGKKTKTMDTASWSVWSVLMYQSLVCFDSLINRGLIEEDFFSEFGMDNVTAFIKQQPKRFPDTLLLYNMNTAMEYNLNRYPEHEAEPRRDPRETLIFKVKSLSENGRILELHMKPL